MAGHNDFGRLGEEKAVAYLKAQGYSVLERNWCLGHKEIDIICTDGKVIVIVEVKTRTEVVDYPEELIDYKKRGNLLSAGAAYIQKKGIKKELRFDLVIVVGEQMKVQHIREAIQVFD